jgi:hypothetical protein
MKGVTMGRKQAVMDIGQAPNLQEYADQVNAAAGQAVQGIIEAGRILVAAKEGVNHGGWERMFQGHAQAIERPIRFSVKTAQRLMVIAQHPSLSKGAHGHLLPSSWRTLYELTKLDESTLEASFHDGRIHPDMQRKDVKALCNGHELKAERFTTDSVFIASFMRKLEGRIEDLLAEVGPTDRNLEDIAIGLDLLRQLYLNRLAKLKEEG